MSVVKQTNKNPGKTIKYKAIKTNKPQPKKEKSHKPKQIKPAKPQAPKKHGSQYYISQHKKAHKVFTKRQSFYKQEIRARDQRKYIQQAFGSDYIEVHRDKRTYLTEVKDLFLTRFFERLKERFGDAWEDEWTIELSNEMMLVSSDEIDEIIKRHEWQNLYYESVTTLAVIDEAETIYSAIKSDLSFLGE